MELSKGVGFTAPFFVYENQLFTFYFIIFIKKAVLLFWILFTKV